VTRALSLLSTSRHPKVASIPFPAAAMGFSLPTDGIASPAPLRAEIRYSPVLLVLSMKLEHECPKKIDLLRRMAGDRPRPPEAVISPDQRDSGRSLACSCNKTDSSILRKAHPV
jgi:hypothetical protein